MSLRQATISRLEADLEALKLERRFAEMDQVSQSSALDAVSEDPRVNLLRSKEQVVRERLDRARNAPDSDWETVKAELLSAWKELRQALEDGDARPT
jgi:hypothetical protein